MFNRTAIMKSAWAQYRRMQGRRTRFDRALFADVLRYVWSEVKRVARGVVEEAARRARAIAEFNAKPAVTVAPMMEMEARIDALKYLSFRHDIGRMERQIRAEYAAA